jgi:Flp pilus assembly protein TadB
VTPVVTAVVGAALAAVLAAAAVAVLVPATGVVPRRLPHHVPAGVPAREPVAEGASGLHRHRAALAVAAALLPVVVLGGPVGAGLGVVAGLWAWRVVAAAETVGERRRRDQAARDLPHVVDLLAVVLESGASSSAAVGTVGSAVHGPLGEELARVRRGLELGGDPIQVWRDAAALPGLAGLSRTMVRALDTGASVAPALYRYASDLHGDQRYAAEERARRVGVKVTAPLGLCLLPAFVLVGVVPLVGATVSGLLAR